MLVTRIDIAMIGSMLEDGNGEGLRQVAFYTVAFFIGNAIMVPAKSIAAIIVLVTSTAIKSFLYLWEALKSSMGFASVTAMFPASLTNFSSISFPSRYFSAFKQRITTGATAPMDIRTSLKHPPFIHKLDAALTSAKA